jgi:gliding motility-associated-like protein
MKRILTISLLLYCYAALAQDLFLKDYPTSTVSTIEGKIWMESYQNDTHIIVGTIPTPISEKKLFLKWFNSCGDILYEKTINVPGRSINVVDVAIDSLENTLALGYMESTTSPKTYFLLSVQKNGTINFLQNLDFNTSSSVLYSVSVSPNNDYNIYFLLDTAIPRTSVLRLKSDGTFKWWKAYQKLPDAGVAIACRDGGILASSLDHIFKLDSLGNLVWLRRYFGIETIHSFIETEQGFCVVRKHDLATSRSSFLMLNKADGSERWSSLMYENFLAEEGIIRKNGHLLFVGGSPLDVSFLEIDTISGATVRFQYTDLLSPVSNFTASNLHEGKKGKVYFSGIDQNFTNNNILVGKFNDTLSSINCTDIQLPFPSNTHPYTFVPAPVVTAQAIPASALTVTTPPYNEATVVSKKGINLCTYTRNRGSYQLGKDTLLCPGQALRIGIDTSTFDAYQWSTGDTSKTILVRQAGTYILSVLSSCDTLKDTINIQYYPEIGLDLGADTSICNGDSLVLGKGLQFSNYLWSDGSTSDTLTAKKPGWYWLEVQTHCGAVRDSINITSPSLLRLPLLPKDTGICPGSKLLLQSPSPTGNLWSNGSNTSQVSIQQSGLYWLEIKQQCDTLRDSIQVTLYPSVLLNYAVSRTQAQTGDSIQFINQTPGASASRWEMDGEATYFSDTVTHTFQLTGSRKITLYSSSINGCIDSISFQVTIEPSNYIIPNIFTPNGDGINDLFFPLGEDIDSYSIKIFNRWGHLLYENKNKAWDGRSKDGRKTKSGIYFYELTLQFNYLHTEVIKGSITLAK